MRDSDIRGALSNYLIGQHALEEDTLIRHEVGLCAGQRRIDLAVVNGEFAGYEIKSDKDTLKRLSGQVDAYGLVLDRAVLVTTPKYIDRAIRALPEWWGVMVVAPSDEGLSLSFERQAELNVEQSPYALAQMLWREEALMELRARGLGRGLSSMARHYVWVALSEALSVDELRSVVRHRLKVRPDWPGGR